MLDAGEKHDFFNGGQACGQDLGGDGVLFVGAGDGDDEVEEGAGVFEAVGDGV